MSRDDKLTLLRRDISIAWVWNYLGLPSKSSRQCKSPFHKDHKPSFSVWHTPEGDKWKDHSTGEGGDVVDFYAKAKDISIGVAIVELYALRNLSSPPVSVPLTKYKLGNRWRKPSAEECVALGKLRKLDPAAFNLAGDLGTLRVGEHPSTKELLWWLTDVSGHASEGRRFDGLACQATGKKVAALPGSRKDLPVGLKTANQAYDRLTRIVMVEGSPDYFAGIHMALRTGINFRVCSMLGAGCNISQEAVPLFEGTSVVIMAHNDEGGQAAAHRWKEQLSLAENAYVTIQPLPTEIKDLNELMLCPIFLSSF